MSLPHARRMRTAIALAYGSTALLVACAPHRAPTPTQHVAARIADSCPTHLTPVGRSTGTSVYAEMVDVIGRGDTTYLLGHPTQLWNASGSVESVAGVAVDSAGHVRPVRFPLSPRDTGATRSVRYGWGTSGLMAVVARDVDADAVAGTRDSVSSSAQLVALTSSGNERALLRVRHDAWQRFRSSLSSDGSGSLLAAYPVPSGPGTHSIAILTSDRRGRKALDTLHVDPASTILAYQLATSLDDGHAVVAAIGVVRALEQLAVFTSLREPGGRWSRLTRLADAPIGAAFVAVANRGAVIGLAWRGAPAGILGSDTLHLAAYHADSRRWSIHSTTEVVRRNLAMAVLRDSTVVAVGRDTSGDTLVIALVGRDGLHTRRIHAPDVGGQPAVHATDDGGLRVFFNIYRNATRDSAALSMATFSNRCLGRLVGAQR